jgi:hypothetical protein
MVAWKLDQRRADEVQAAQSSIVEAPSNYFEQLDVELCSAGKTVLVDMRFAQPASASLTDSRTLQLLRFLRSAQIMQRDKVETWFDRAPVALGSGTIAEARDALQSAIVVLEKAKSVTVHRPPGHTNDVKQWRVRLLEA